MTCAARLIAEAGLSAAPPRSTTRAVLLAGGAALAALLLPALHRPALRLAWNVSASVPVGLYRIEPDVRVRRGDLAAVRPSPAMARFMADRRYVEANALLVKPIAAVAGQRVCRVGTTVTIDGHITASALRLDSRNRPLPVWRGCRQLGASELFLLAPAVAASFDGRYFGPTPTGRVIGLATPVWTW